MDHNGQYHVHLSPKRDFIRCILCGCHPKGDFESLWLGKVRVRKFAHPQTDSVPGYNIKQFIELQMAKYFCREPFRNFERMKMNHVCKSLAPTCGTVIIAGPLLRGYTMCFMTNAGST